MIWLFNLNLQLDYNQLDLIRMFTLLWLVYRFGFKIEEQNAESMKVNYKKVSHY